MENTSKIKKSNKKIIRNFFFLRKKNYFSNKYSYSHSNIKFLFSKSNFKFSDKSNFKFYKLKNLRKKKNKTKKKIRHTAIFLFNSNSFSFPIYLTLKAHPKLKKQLSSKKILVNRIAKRLKRKNLRQFRYKHVFKNKIYNFVSGKYKKRKKKIIFFLKKKKKNIW